MIPTDQKTHNDLIDILIEGSQDIVTVETEDGKLTEQLRLNPEILYWSTRIVNSPNFGRFVFELKEFERLAKSSYNNMMPRRAKVISDEILSIVESFKRSIDGKSSESRLDKNNTSATLIDKINRNKVEKYYNVKGEAKKSFMDGLLGRQGEEERD